MFSNVIFGHFPKPQGRCVTQVLYSDVKIKKKLTKKEQRVRVNKTPKFVSVRLENENDRAVVGVLEERNKQNASVSCFRFRCNVAFDIYNFSCLSREIATATESNGYSDKITCRNKSIS